MSPASLPEREVERRQQGARFLVGVRRGADGDVHAPDLRRLVVVDLGENDVLLEAERIIAAAVEALGIEAAEIAHPRQRNVDDDLVDGRHLHGVLVAELLDELLAHHIVELHPEAWRTLRLRRRRRRRFRLAGFFRLPALGLALFALGLLLALLAAVRLTATFG